MLQTFKKVLANSEPSTHGGKADMTFCGALTQSGHCAASSLNLQARFTATSLLFWGAPERRRMAWQLQFLASVGDFRTVYLEDRHVAVEEVPDISVCSVR
jgi:hypothetical protein